MRESNEGGHELDDAVNLDSPGKVNMTDAANDHNGQLHSRVIGLDGGGFLVAWEDDTNTYAQVLFAVLTNRPGNIAANDFVVI